MDDWPDLRSLNVNLMNEWRRKNGWFEFENGLRTKMFTFTTIASVEAQLNDFNALFSEYIILKSHLELMAALTGLIMVSILTHLILQSAQILLVELRDLVEDWTKQRKSMLIFSYYESPYLFSN